MFCPQCGNEVADDQLFCQHCGARLRGEFPPAEAAPGPGSRETTPWEDREARGFWAGLLRTLFESLFHPSEFFRKMPVTGGLTNPLLYALIIGMTGLIFSYFWQIVAKGAMPGMQFGVGRSLFGGIGMALLAFFSPFVIIIGLFVSAGILHLCLMLVKGSKAGFEGTFRVVSYGYSANIFMVIPFCGGLIAGAWAIVLSIIGLREAHETTGGKAAVAVFLPLIICCGLFAFAGAIFLGAAAGSLGVMLQELQK
jgi:hypothetical protein